jgi:hypothetical protein
MTANLILASHTLPRRKDKNGASSLQRKSRKVPTGGMTIRVQLKSTNHTKENDTKVTARCTKTLI